ncbi:MAG: LicD family protein [Bacteroidales bacterium]|nr:LicD family protein [Bacteroidales bacterium]
MNCNQYNPQGSLRRKAQIRMLHILEVVDAICRDEHIDYWMDAGTLLGAVRHKGFVPWDDDLDICIMRRDYARFKRAALKRLPADLAFQDWTTDKYHFEMSPRIRDLHSLFDQPESKCQKYRGLFLDVILVERVPSMKIKQMVYFFYGRVTREIHNYGYAVYTSKKRILMNKILAYIFWLPTMTLTNIARLTAWAIQSDVVSRFYSPFRGPRCLSDIFPCRELEFENHLFYAPANPDAYLRKQFGDYMTLPPESERKGHDCGIEIYS